MLVMKLRGEQEGEMVGGRGERAKRQQTQPAPGLLSSQTLGPIQRSLDLESRSLFLTIVHPIDVDRY